MLVNGSVPSRKLVEAPDFSHSDDDGGGEDHVSRSFTRSSDRFATCFRDGAAHQAWSQMRLIDQLQNLPTRSRKAPARMNISDTQTKDYSNNAEEEEGEIVVLDAHHVMPFKKRKLPPPSPPSPPSPPARTPAVAYASWRKMGLTEIVRSPR